MSNHKDLQKISASGLLISLGIIYGDIGTSPWYVLKAIIGTNKISETLVLGGVSLIFWILIMFVYMQLKKISLSEECNFGLGLSFVTVEKVPLMRTSPDSVEIHRLMHHHK